MPVEIVAELATAHGGDVGLAEDMVAAAADAGAHTVKIQTYTLERLNPKDPQADWLRQSWLSRAAIEDIMRACIRRRVGLLATPFDRESFVALLKMGCHRIKVPSSLPLWGHGPNGGVFYVKSWAWGAKPDWSGDSRGVEAHLTAIPLYPTPIEAVAAAPLLDGWSDHTVGTAVCKHMISKGARIIEAHFCLPGRSRQMPWDKSPAELREIRDHADAVETMTTGVSQQFRERWSV